MSQLISPRRVRARTPARVAAAYEIAPGPGARHAASALLPATPETSDWLVWQLMDSAFPTGGFAHSSGLEAAWQHGEVRGRDDLVAFVEASLDQMGHASLPVVMAAFDGPEKLGEFDRLCDAFTSNHVANRASRTQGRALLTAVERIFRAENGRQPIAEALPHAHFAPVFGACLAHLGIPRETAGRMFFCNQLRSVLTAAVRLNIVGPMEAQILMHRLSAKAETVLQACQRLTLDEMAQTAPLLDLWQGAQDRLYSRLFQS
jgi:urease accessory protein